MGRDLHLPFEIELRVKRLSELFYSDLVFGFRVVFTDRHVLI